MVQGRVVAPKPGQPLSRAAAQDLRRKGADGRHAESGRHLVQLLPVENNVENTEVEERAKTHTVNANALGGEKRTLRIREKKKKENTVVPIQEEKVNDMTTYPIAQYRNDSKRRQLIKPIACRHTNLNLPNVLRSHTKNQPFLEATEWMDCRDTTCV